jgi:NAD(P)-dependent dehydrogenase (short-subunit alcohol dehydrogenase family)
MDMQELRGKVAVVTGGASGIGYALAERFGREGMRVVVADVESTALDEAVRQLKQHEHDVIGVLTDVSSEDSVRELARRTIDAYGKVHVLCNNAGVMGGQGLTMWTAAPQEWQWVFGVNFWGVVHGIRAFLPIMLAQDEEGHVVNTASVGGLTPGRGIYGISKHAVVALTESLNAELRLRDTRIGVSCLCPLTVQTRIPEADRNRPEELVGGEDPRTPDELEVIRTRFRNFLNEGVAPDVIAGQVIEGIREDRFYLLNDTWADDVIRARIDYVLNRENPDPTVAFGSAWRR